MPTGIPNSSGPNFKSRIANSLLGEIRPVSQCKFNPGDYTVLVVDDDTAFLVASMGLGVTLDVIDQLIKQSREVLTPPSQI